MAPADIRKRLFDALLLRFSLQSFLVRAASLLQLPQRLCIRHCSAHHLCSGSVQALFRLCEGSVKALLRLWSVSMKAQWRFNEGSMKALWRLYEGTMKLNVGSMSAQCRLNDGSMKALSRLYSARTWAAYLRQALLHSLTTCSSIYI